MDISLIDRAFEWVQHPFAFVVFLLGVVAVLAWVLWGFHKRMKGELAECWDLHERGQKEIIELTGFLFEAITLAGAPRSKQHTSDVDDLKTRVEQFHHEKQLQYERDRAERRARQK